MFKLSSQITDNTSEMLRLFFPILLLLISGPSQATLCSAFFAKRLKSQVMIPDTTDKWKHCALSCLLARRCGAEDAFVLGVIKELADLVGPGAAEWADLQADANGVTLWRLGFGRNDQMCKDQCASLYPTPIEVNACHLPG